MLGLKPLAVSEPSRAESDWYLVSRSNRHNFTRDFGILNVTYNIIKFFKAYHNDLVHNTYRAEFPFEFPTIVYCSFVASDSQLIFINTWIFSSYGGIIILGKEGNKTPSSMNEELPSNKRTVVGLQQCKFSLNGMTSSFVSLVAGYAQ